MRPESASRVVLSRAFAACMAILVGAAAAQATDDKVLSGKAVTESNLVDALTPKSDADTGGSTRGDVDVSGGQRSLHVSGTAGATMAATMPRKKAAASLLITFETSSSQLTERSKQQLDVVGAALRNDRLKDFNFDIEGHSDPRGNPDANLLLSQQRAESVRTYLVKFENIPENKLHAIGKGDKEPLNKTDVAAPENRRVTIVTNAP